MIQTYLKRMPELAISGTMILIMLLFSLIFNLPIIYPSGERAAFVGIHYIYPLIGVGLLGILRSEEHTSELQSLMRSSYAVFCLKTKIIQHGMNNDELTINNNSTITSISTQHTYTLA